MKQNKQSTSSTGKRIGIAVAVAVALGFAFWGASATKDKPVAQPPATGGDLLAVVSDDYVKGNPEAPVTLVEYLDFECEACGAYYPLLKQLSTEFPDDLRIVTRYFPLPGHRNGMTAALAVEAAARQDRYQEMHDALFENQRAWGEQQRPDPALFERYAQQIGLDLERFKADAKDKSVRERVERDVASGTELGNTGTPSFFLNGKKLENPGSYEALKAAIQAALNEAGSAPTTTTSSTVPVEAQ